MGWALLDEAALVAAGSCDYSDSGPMRWELQRGDMLGLLRTHEPDLVVCERPMGVFKTWAATRSVIGTYIIAEQVAGVLRCAFKGVSASTIKKRATGHGRASKPAVIRAARKQFGVLANEHTADALFAALTAWPAQGSLGDGF
jgi:Holliday junction resolvasome RuvABC endonuclease subunit